jgi:hypothetical protein
MWRRRFGQVASFGPIDARSWCSFHTGHSLLLVSAHSGISKMVRRGISFTAELVVGLVLLMCPFVATAQHHGGHGGAGGGIPGGSNRPTGLDEKDSLKDFHHALAVQATSQQIAEFQAVVKDTDTAKAKLQTLEQQSGNAAAETKSPVSGAEIDQVLESAREASRKFVKGFSAPQKSGLKDITKRLEKSDSDLEQEEKKLDQSLQVASGASADIEARAKSVSKALSDFSNQQLALGREMGIVLASGDDLTFRLAEVKSPVTMGDRTIAVTVSGALSQIAVQGSQRTFRLEMIADLSDLQQNITELLRPRIDPASACGERVAVRRATIIPSAPAGVLNLQLHYERWSCTRTFGQTSNELAEGDGSVEIRLTPSIDKSNTLKLVAEFSRIDAVGMMGEALRSGDLGGELRDKVSQAILPAVQAAANFKTNLPPAVQNSAVAQSARFQDARPGELSVLIDGQMEVSNDQVNLMASQLNQTLAAQGAPSR